MAGGKGGWTPVSSGSGSGVTEGAAVRRAATTTAASGSTITITFDTADTNTDSMWSAGDPTKLTAQTAGWYVITGHVYWNNSGTGFRQVALAINGAARHTQGCRSESTSYFVPQEVSLVTYLGVGDYITMTILASGGASSLLGDARLSMVLIG